MLSDKKKIVACHKRNFRSNKYERERERERTCYKHTDIEV